MRTSICRSLANILGFELLPACNHFHFINLPKNATMQVSTSMDHPSLQQSKEADHAFQLVKSKALRFDAQTMKLGNKLSLIGNTKSTYKGAYHAGTNVVWISHGCVAAILFIKSIVALSLLIPLH